MSTDFPTLTAALDARAGAGAVTFIDGADDERRVAFAVLRERALVVLARLRAAGLVPGDYLLLFVDDNCRFLEYFWAALYGAIVPVPVAAGAPPAHLEKLLKLWRLLGEPALATEPRLLDRLRRFVDADTGARLVACALAPQPPGGGLPAASAVIDAGATALLQFSSGATGDPKGVLLSHANICTNIRAISMASVYRRNEIALSWMPLTHDMGLIGFHLTMLANGFDHYLMRTDVFARRPLLWLHKAAEKRATLLCAPNFGYRHLLRAVAAKGLPAVDLSAVRLIYNGAEPISAALADEFLRRLAPTGLPAQCMFPVYGLAEASLAVTFPKVGDGMTTVSVDRRRLGLGETVVPLAAGDANALVLARLGAAIPDCRLRLVDSAGQTVNDGIVGRVQIAGGNVTTGYLHNAAANRAASTGDGWLDTGDLGFIDDGSLVIAGRAEEIVFVNGHNHYPQDIEAAATGADGLELNKVAAAGIRRSGADTDELVLFVVFRGAMEQFLPIAGAVAGQVNRRTGLVVDRVVPLQRIPKTTSGKLQRSRLAKQYADGAFAAVLAALDAFADQDGAGAPAPDQSQDIGAILKRICDNVVPDKNVGSGDNLFEIGLSSLDLAQIHEGIEQRYPGRLEITDLFDYPSINELADFLGTGEWGLGTG